MKINNLMKRLSATIVAIALTFSSLVLPLDAIAAVSSSTAATEDTNTDNSGEGGVSGDSDKSGDNSGEETPDEGFDIKDFHNSSEGNWTNGKVSVSFSVTKNIEEVDYSYFDEDIEANRKTSEDGKFSFDFDNEQDKEHTFYVVDKEGNVTEVGKTNVKIDKSEPEIADFKNDSNGNWTNKNVKVSFYVNDVLSGVAGVYVDGKEIKAVNGKYNCTFTEEQDKEHTVLVKDNAGNSIEKTVNVKIDTSAPEITLNNDHDKKWTNKDVTVNITATDKLSDVSKVYADGKEIKANNGEYSVAYSDQQNKEHTFYAVDKAGNKSEVKSTKVQIDKTKPSISSKVNYTNISYKDGVSIANQLKLPMPSLSGMVIARNYIVLEVDASDDMSGIDETDRGSFVLKNDKETMKTLAVEKSGDRFAVIANAENLNAKEGIISDVKVYAKDRAGNLSDAYKDKITFDTRKPKCGIDGFTLNDKCDEYKISGFKPTTERKVYAIVTSDASLKDSGDELAAAVKEAVEKNEKLITVNEVDVDIVTPVEGNKYDFSFPTGNESFYVNVIDEVGNVSEFEFKADKTPIDDSDIKLSATKKVDNKDIEYIQKSWTNSDVTVEVSVPDEKVAWNGNTATAVTKLSAVYWSKDNKLDPANVTADAEKIERDENGKFKQTFEKSGTYYFYAVDEAGNVSEGQEFEILVDKEAPEIDSFDNYSGEEWTNKDVTVKIEASDDVSGIAKVYVDDEKNVIREENGVYSYTFSKDKPQNVKHTFYVVDNAGNVTKKETWVKIDTSEPEIDEFTNNSGGNWTNGNVTVTFKVKDKGENFSKTDKVYVDNVENVIDCENGVYSYTFKEEQNGNHTFFVKNTAGNVSQVKTWVRIDKKAPIIKGKPLKIVDEKDNEIDNIVSLAWCIICNDDIFVKLPASEVEDPENDIDGSFSGVASVTLKTENKENNNVYQVVTETEKGDYVFKIPNTIFAENVKHDNLRFVVTDKASNNSTAVYTLNSLTEKQISDNVLIDKVNPIIENINLLGGTEIDGKSLV